MIQHVLDALSQGSIYALLALGVAFLFGVARVVNFAYGELIALAGYVALGVAGVAWPLGVLAIVLAVVALALATERIVFAPARRASPMTILVISFALSFFLQNALVAAFGTRAKGVDFGVALTKPVSLGGADVSRLNLVIPAVTAVLLAALVVFLRRAPIGRQLRAAAEDFEMVRLLGIPANRVLMTAFALAGGLAATAGMLLAIQSGTLQPSMGTQPVVTALVATVIGGMGSLVGAVVGGYVLGIVSVLLQVLLPDGALPFHQALVYGFVLALLLARPQGLLAARLGERV
jgi:branched-chain amino acid transport system permease protein